MNTASEIVLYGPSWCGGTRRARALLERNNIPFRWVDIEQDDTAARYLESIAGGFRSVPTLTWPDGSMLVEPSEQELAKKLGVEIS